VVVSSRALHLEDKAARRAQIVAAATRLLERDPVNFASVADVAREAGLAKGTVYLYFKTKEEMLMAIHMDQSFVLFDQLDAALTSTGELNSLNLVDAFCEFVATHPLYLQVAAICHSSLERNIDHEVLVGFRMEIGARLMRTGQLMEQRFPQAVKPHGPGGLELLHHTYAFAIGTWQLCDPVHQKTHENDPVELQMFKRDVSQDLRIGITALWTGFTVAAQSPLLRSGAVAAVGREASNETVR
jgi:AcrR family transcriptional regulator